MWPDRVSNPKPLALESDALPTDLRGPANDMLVICNLKMFSMHQYLPIENLCQLIYTAYENRYQKASKYLFDQMWD